MLAFGGYGRVLAISPLLRQSLPYVVQAVIELLPQPPESWAYGVPSYLLCLGLGLWLGITSRCLRPKGLARKQGQMFPWVRAAWSPALSWVPIHCIDPDMAVALYSWLVPTLPGSQLWTSGKTREEETRESWGRESGEE